MKIIGFAGLAQAGKTTAAEACAHRAYNLGLRPVMERFAGPLKDASNMVGFVKGGEYDEQYRAFCQMVGKTAREISEDWWVDRMADRIAQIALDEASEVMTPVWSERVIFIDDVRYRNEVDLIRRLGGVTIFVSAAGRLTDLDADWRKHESEALATAYERLMPPTGVEVADETFDFLVSNNTEGSGQFQDTVAKLVEIHLTAAKEA